MNKFKVGDKVVINKVDLWTEGRFCVFTTTMSENIGRTLAISTIKGSYYGIEHPNDQFFYYEEEWLSPVEDDHPVYKDGKIDVKKLGTVINSYGGGGCKLKLFSDGSGYIANRVDDPIDSLQRGDLNHLNTLYKEITTQKKSSLMEQIVKDSIEQEIKKMEAAIAELRKQIN